MGFSDNALREDKMLLPSEDAKVTEHEVDIAIGFAIGAIGTTISAIGGYLIWGLGAAMLTGGSAIVLLAAMMIVRSTTSAAGESEEDSPARLSAAESQRAVGQPPYRDVPAMHSK
jgi:hypothetical protein